VFACKKSCEKEAIACRKYLRGLDRSRRGQIQLEESTERPILAGICTKTRSRFSYARCSEPCVTIERGAVALGRSRIACSLNDMDGWIGTRTRSTSTSSVLC